MIEHVFMIVLAVIASVGIMGILYILGWFIWDMFFRSDKDKLND